MVSGMVTLAPDVAGLDRPLEPFDAKYDGLSEAAYCEQITYGRDLEEVMALARKCREARHAADVMAGTLAEVEALLAEYFAGDTGAVRKMAALLGIGGR